MRTFLTLAFSWLLLFGTISAQQQLQNSGFEAWEDVGTAIDEPVNWSSIKTSDNDGLNISAPVVWGRSNDAHTGNYSLSLENRTAFNIVATGMITNGRVHSSMITSLAYVYTDLDNEQWHGAITERPDSIVGWFKCNPAPNDFGTVKFLLHTGYAQLPGGVTNHIALAYYELPAEEITQWTRFSTPFVYSSDDNPEYCLTVITSGNGTEAIDGSTALFDDFEFIYNEASVNEIPESQFHAYVADKQLNFIVEENSHQVYEVRLIDISGRTILVTEVITGENNKIGISDLQPGIYIVVANNSQHTLTRKILIN